MSRVSFRQRSLLLSAAMLCWFTLAAGAGEFQLEFSVRGAGDSRPFVYRATLERAVADDLARGRPAAVQDQLQEARRAYAEKKGYREAIYGKENWKMVRVDDWSWKVVDGGSGRTIGSGGRNGGS